MSLIFFINYTTILYYLRNVYTYQNGWIIPKHFNLYFLHIAKNRLFHRVKFHLPMQGNKSYAKYCACTIQKDMPTSCGLLYVNTLLTIMFCECLFLYFILLYLHFAIEWITPVWRALRMKNDVLGILNTQYFQLIFGMCIVPRMRSWDRNIVLICNIMFAVIISESPKWCIP